MAQTTEEHLRSTEARHPMASNLATAARHTAPQRLAMAPQQRHLMALQLRLPSTAAHRRTADPPHLLLPAAAVMVAAVMDWLGLAFSATLVEMVVTL